MPDLESLPLHFLGCQDLRGLIQQLRIIAFQR